MINEILLYGHVAAKVINIKLYRSSQYVFLHHFLGGQWGFRVGQIPYNSPHFCPIKSVTDYIKWAPG